MHVTGNRGRLFSSRRGGTATVAKYPCPRPVFSRLVPLNILALATSLALVLLGPMLPALATAGIDPATGNSVSMQQGDTSPQGRAPPALSVSPLGLTFVVNSMGDAADAVPSDGVCSTGATIASGDAECTLRAAIQTANAIAGADTVSFNIPGTGPYKIYPNSTGLGGLPQITDPVTIDATTQPGFSGTPKVEIGGEFRGGSFTDGLYITAGSSTVRGLSIYRMGYGIHLATNGGNTIAGNYFGVDSGGGYMPSDVGILIGPNSSNNIIGGTASADRNWFYGHYEQAITIDNVSSGSTTTGNNAIKGNDFQYSGVVSIYITGSAGNTIGGTESGAGNYFYGGSGNVGIWLQGATNNQILGNTIGTNRTGNAYVGLGIGIRIVLGSTNNIIGGTTAAARNVIINNSDAGIRIEGSSGNEVLGNYIGVKADGSTALGNGGRGIFITQGSSNNLIGGTASGAGNVIAYNGGDGVFIDSGSGNAVRWNSIFANGGLGIDLGTDGVTANDAGDGDTGANGLQNFPVLTAAYPTGPGNTTVQGVLNSLPDTTYSLDFYYSAAADPSGYGEGQTWFGGAWGIVTTDAQGAASFTFEFGGVPAGYYITATASYLDWNTSEFSQALQYVPYVPLAVTTSSLPGGVVGVAYSQTLAATGGETTPYTWSIASGALPPGLSLAGATGVVSGTPTTAGTYSFTAQVTDSSSPAQTATQALSIVVAAPTPTPVELGFINLSVGVGSRLDPAITPRLQLPLAADPWDSTCTPSAALFSNIAMAPSTTTSTFDAVREGNPSEYDDIVRQMTYGSSGSLQHTLRFQGSSGCGALAFSTSGAAAAGWAALIPPSSSIAFVRMTVPPFDILRDQGFGPDWVETSPSGFNVHIGFFGFTTGARVRNLPTGLKLLTEDLLTDLSQVTEVSPLRGLLLDAPGHIVARFALQFSQSSTEQDDVDFGSALTAVSDQTTGKAVLHRAGGFPTGVGTRDLYVPKLSGHNRVRVCPNATTLGEVSATCSGGFVLAPGQTHASGVRLASATTTISGQVYWLVENVSGTGAQGEAAAPTVSSVSPNSGPTAGGTSVTITGTGFVATPTVTFGGVAATSVVWVSTTSLTAVTPAHAAGAVDVVVTNPDSQSGTLAGGYTYVTPAADLLLTKSDSPDPVTAGNNLTYSLTVANNGPSVATGVTLTDTLPGGVSLISTSPSQGNCSGTVIVTCNLNNINNGANATVSIVVRPASGGSLTNTASVSALEEDPATTNNVATATTTVTAGIAPTQTPISPASSSSAPGGRALPDPATWALMLSGIAFLALYAMLSHRRRQT